MNIIKSKYGDLFSPKVFLAQEKKYILYLSESEPHPVLSIKEIWEKIEFSRLIVNNLSMSKCQLPVDKEEYSDGVFVDSSKVLDLFDGGASIIMRGAHRYFREVRELCNKISKIWGCETQANLYLSKAGVDATYPHFDPHELYIYQIYGEKDWNFYESKFIQPEYTDGYDAVRHGHGKKSETLRMNAGDIAFIPRGTIHQPISVTNSVHVSIGVKAISYGQLLDIIIGLLKESNVEFRKNAFQGKSYIDVSKDIDNLLSVIKESCNDFTLASIEKKLQPDSSTPKCLSDIFDR